MKLHVSHSSSAHHQEFFTAHTAMVYVIQICRQLASRIRTDLNFHPPDDGQRNYPKHVEFHSKNKLEKLMYLVGFIIILFTMHGHLNVKNLYKQTIC